LQKLRQGKFSPGRPRQLLKPGALEDFDQGVAVPLQDPMTCIPLMFVAMSDQTMSTERLLLERRVIGFVPARPYTIGAWIKNPPNLRLPQAPRVIHLHRSSPRNSGDIYGASRTH
jgi:hypothetical protein